MPPDTDQDTLSRPPERAGRRPIHRGPAPTFFRRLSSDSPSASAGIPRPAGRLSIPLRCSGGAAFPHADKLTGDASHAYVWSSTPAP